MCALVLALGGVGVREGKNGWVSNVPDNLARNKQFNTSLASLPRCTAFPTIDARNSIMRGEQTKKPMNNAHAKKEGAKKEGMKLAVVLSRNGPTQS